MKTAGEKIVHIPNYYPPHIGGIEDVCHSIVSALPDFQHQVICFHNQKTTQRDIYEGIPVTRSSVWKKLFSQSISFSFYTELKRIFKEFDPDIVHFHTPNPLSSVYVLMLLPKKTKLIVHWHSDIIAQDRLYLFYQWVEKRLLKRADKIIMTSPTYLSGSKALQAWKDKLQVIPNTVNTDKLQKKEGDEEAIAAIRNLYKGKKIIFTFGRHVPYKGIKYLIEAAPLISEDAVIVIAGSGPLTDELKSRSTASSSIHFIGRLSDDALRHYLYASDVFAFPSITRNEAFGIALAEAMYCGLPAVTFTIPDSGVNWVSINGETGLESENGNVGALAEAINKLLEDNALRTRLGKNASERVREQFTSDAIKEDLILLYKDF
ncbi:MAG: glycosyltransferase [Candidatus Symbiothrix sp.]|jgi:glycosyltransferase involved in cell wall biosynthesis|nr:glycosyltransferase [Candidatus Symbiothrix sp.]